MINTNLNAYKNKNLGHVIYSLSLKFNLTQGTHPTANDILIEFEIQWNFALLLFISYSANHNDILLMSRTLLWRVQNFVMNGQVYFKPEHCKFWSNTIEISLVGWGPGLWPG